MADAVEERIDELFRRPPDEFTRARDALAKELRAAGDADAARRVRGLRKPTVAARTMTRRAAGRARPTRKQPKPKRAAARDEEALRDALDALER